MTSLAGPLHAAALVVLVAAAAKVVRPTAAAAALRSLGLPGTRSAVRVIAAAEAVVAVAVLAGVDGGRPPAAALAALHLGFAAIAAALRARAATCGCFGEATPVTGTHLVVNVAVAGLALAAAATGDIASVGAAAGATPAAGAPYLLLMLTLAAAEITVLTALAEVQAVLKDIPVAERQVLPSERAAG
jgi:hypothetical protein